MILQEIEYYFKQNQLEELLSKYQDCFTDINKYEEEFKQGTIITAVTTDKAMKHLGSLFCSLNIVSVLAKIYADDAKTSRINYLRSQYATENREVGITELKQQAYEYAKNFNRIQAVFEGYRDNCEKLIFICQSSLKSEERERSLNRGKSG